MSRDAESASAQLSDDLAAAVEAEQESGESRSAAIRRLLRRGVRAGGVEERASTATELRAKVKRGTGTRDQDTLVIKGRGATAAEAAEDFEAALDRAETKQWASRLRALQPQPSGARDE